MSKFSISKIADSRHRLVACLVMGVVVSAILLGGIFHNQVKTQLNAWKLLPQPERLTELYFTKPNALPTKYISGQPQTVSFTVHNLEYSTMTYHYQIIEKNQNGSQYKTLYGGAFTLRPNIYQSETLKITPVDFGNRVKVAVKLLNINESIDYWAYRSDS